MSLLLLLIALAAVMFYAILQLEISGILKFFLVFAEMVVVGQVMIKRFRMPSEMGLILLKSKRGLAVIEKLAKNKDAWHFMADAGAVAAYGLSSRLFIKDGSAKSLMAGLALLAFVSYIVAPTAFVFLFDVLDIGGVEKSVSFISDYQDMGMIIVALILLVGGFTLFILSGIIFYGGIVLRATLESVFFGQDTISGISPGGTFLLPGINLPLFEGILALVVVMIVHEGAHAVLSRIAKVPLLSSGLVFFGIIPIGAFIEPDEAKLAKVDAKKQTRVLIAGPTSNLLSSVVFFLLFAALVLAINNIEALHTGVVGGATAFIYVTLGLTFALNFIVGAVNLLPLPLFDGFRAFDINVKNKLVVKTVMYITLFFFIMNFLPWLFR